MTAAFSIERHGMWLAIPCLVVAVFLLVRSITGVVRTVRQARLFTAPLVESQEVELADAGRVVLAVEGPLMSRRHAGLRYELVGPYGLHVTGRRPLFRAVSSGWTTSSIQVMAFDVARPGRHVLRIQGLGGATPDDARHRVVFLRPHVARTVVGIVAIILSAALVIGSLLVFLWGLLGVRPR
jgi:hypothetical protein